MTTLRIYACGGHQLAIGDFIGAHQSTISRIVHRVTNAIARSRPLFVTIPNDNERLRVATDFYNIARFPRVIGCVDGTHIRMQSPGNRLKMCYHNWITLYVFVGGEQAEAFRNRKAFFSINTQVICDAKLKIRDIVARWPGSSHDLTIFNNSRIRAQFENNEFQNSILLGKYLSI